MSLIFNGPIPGQSLTSEPKGLPFERPPEIADPIKALEMHIENMSQPEALEDKPIINVREDVQEEETEVETTDIAPASMGLMARV